MNKNKTIEYGVILLAMAIVILVLVCTYRLIKVEELINQHETTLNEFKDMKLPKADYTAPDGQVHQVEIFPYIFQKFNEIQNTEGK
jgi:hypothetical protein